MLNQCLILQFRFSINFSHFCSVAYEKRQFLWNLWHCILGIFRFQGRSGSHGDVGWERPESDAGSQGNGASCGSRLHQNPCGFRLHHPLAAAQALVYLMSLQPLGSSINWVGNPHRVELREGGSRIVLSCIGVTDMSICVSCIWGSVIRLLGVIAWIQTVNIPYFYVHFY